MMSLVCVIFKPDGHLEYRLGFPKILAHCGFNITQDYFDDEDELEEKLLEELKQVRKAEEKAKAEKDAAEKLKREAIRQKLLEEKEELRRLGVRNTWLGTPEIKPKRLESSLPPLVVDDAEFSFKPRQLESTLPPLVVNTSNPQEEVEDEVRQIESNLDTLQITESSDIHKLTGSKLESQLLAYASLHQSDGAAQSSFTGAGDRSYTPYQESPNIQQESPVEQEESPETSTPAFESFLVNEGVLNVWDEKQWDS